MKAETTTQCANLGVREKGLYTKKGISDDDNNNNNSA